LYEDKGEHIGIDTLRDIERRVMLSVIDQHWREHLYEMDYLQEGINLRAMGQQDPLSEWQREGFDMFEAMMGQIEDDFVRYVFHLQVVVDEEPGPDIRNVSYSAPTDPVQGSSSIEAAMAAQAAEAPLALDDEPMPVAPEPVQQQPVRAEKTPGRNEPCFCGSGKKYKLCHGR
jgi:preprotein translocase subunit SecA